MALPSACLGQLAAINCDANGESCDYTASFAVQQDDSITITMSAMTGANMWVGIGVSDNQMMVGMLHNAYSNFNECTPRTHPFITPIFKYSLP